jgi:hypothetical protein
MKEFLKRVWQCKYVILSFCLFLSATDDLNKIMCAIFIGIFGLKMQIEDLLEEIRTYSSKSKYERLKLELRLREIEKNKWGSR